MVPHLDMSRFTNSQVFINLPQQNMTQNRDGSRFWTWQATLQEQSNACNAAAEDLGRCSCSTSAQPCSVWDSFTEPDIDQSALI